MKQETEIEKINRIMRDENQHELNINVAHFKPDEKCNAIYNFMRNNDISFSTAFVDSVYDQYLQRGAISERQESAIDNILKKFNIDLDKWGV